MINEALPAAEAVRPFLLADPDVHRYSEGRIYAHELPRGDTRLMPRACLVIQEAPGRAQGPGARTWARLQTTTLDVIAYGADKQQAGRLAEAVSSLLPAISRKLLPGDQILHDLTATGGPLPSRDRETDWPMVVTSYTALIGYPSRS